MIADIRILEIPATDETEARQVIQIIREVIDYDPQGKPRGKYFTPWENVRKHTFEEKSE